MVQGRMVGVIIISARNDTRSVGLFLLLIGPSTGGRRSEQGIIEVEIKWEEGVTSGWDTYICKSLTLTTFPKVPSPRVASTLSAIEKITWAFEFVDAWLERLNADVRRTAGFFRSRYDKFLFLPITNLTDKTFVPKLLCHCLNDLKKKRKKKKI